MIHIVDAGIVSAVVISWAFAVVSCFTKNDRKSSIWMFVAYSILALSLTAALAAPKLKDNMKLEKALTVEQQEELAAEYTCQVYADLYEDHEGTTANYERVQQMDWLSVRERVSIARFLEAATRVNRTLGSDLDSPHAREERYNAVFLSCMKDGNQKALCEKLPKAHQANCR